LIIIIVLLSIYS